MRAVLVRHGESVSNADPKVSLPDAEGDRLTERGREQAAAAGEALKGYGVTDLVCSPMRRARETAAEIRERLGLDPTVDEGIHELTESPDFGSLSSEEQMRRRWSEWMPRFASDPGHSEYGGESFNQVRERVRAFQRRLVDEYGDRTPAVVTHGIFLRFFLAEALLGDGFGPALAPRLWNLRTINCGISVFEHGERHHPADPVRPGWVCASWMERPRARP